MVADEIDWYPMWRKLGINIEKHDQLLAALPEIFKKIYIESQKKRPKGMDFFDFVVGDIHGIRPSELIKAKTEGRPIIGTFCLYIPEEIILAIDGICVGLCGGTNFSIYAIEDKMPANLCSLIKSSLGFEFGKICPYFAACDLIIGETTCDGKKKAWEILGKEREVYVVETPQIKTRKIARTHYIEELKALIDYLEKKFNKKLTFEKLKKGIIKIEEKRRQLRRINNTRKQDPVPISGKDALLVTQISFYDDPDREIQMISKLVEELENRDTENGGIFPKGTKRIIISGTPQAIPNWKVHHIIENNGAVVVAEETCTGTRYYENSVKETGNNINELIENLADRYLNINCACFTPNDGRLDDILRLVEEFNADGVILYTLNFCQSYEIEGIGIEKKLKEKGIKVLNITTDYSSEDDGPLQTRIEAFIEMLK